MLSQLLGFFNALDPDDSPGTVVFVGAFDRIHADLRDPDRIVSVQSAEFLLDSSTEFFVDGSSISERSDDPGTWRATIMHSSSGTYTVKFVYTDSRGAGKIATGRHVF